MPDINKIFPPDRYELIPKVAVFKTHKRHKGGRLVEVDKEELEKIAKNHNNQFVKLLRASPFSKGHTLDEGPDGADVPEENQPDVVGFGVRFCVDKHPSEPNEDYLFCDLYIKKTEISVLEKYPAISPEYYPSLHQLYPISFLKSSAPELTLPPVLHRYELEAVSEDEPYRLTMTNPIAYTKENMDKDIDKKLDKDDVVKDAQDKETKGAKVDDARLTKLEEQMAEIAEVLPALKELVEMLTQAEGQEGEEGEGAEGEEGDKGDLLKPAEGKEEAVVDKKPEKFEASAATATNVSVPSNEKKEDYTVDNDELVRYKAEVQAEIAKLRAEKDEVKKIAEDLNKKNRRAEAEKLVYELENKFNIVFSNTAVREEEVVTFTELDPESAQIYFERAKLRYQKKLPDTVEKIVKYSADNPDDIKSLPPEESKKLADKILAKGLSFNEYLAKQREPKA